MQKYLKFSLALGVAAVLTGCTEVSSALNSINKVASGAALATELEPSAICKEWRENEVRASQKYVDKMIKFSGKLTHITASIAGNAASFKAANADVTYVPQSAAADNIANLTKGKKYVVTGKVLNISHSLDPNSKCSIGLVGVSIE